MSVSPITDMTKRLITNGDIVLPPAAAVSPKRLSSRRCVLGYTSNVETYRVSGTDDMRLVHGSDSGARQGGGHANAANVAEYAKRGVSKATMDVEFRAIRGNFATFPDTLVDAFPCVLLLVAHRVVIGKCCYLCFPTDNGNTQPGVLVSGAEFAELIAKHNAAAREDQRDEVQLVVVISGQVEQFAVQLFAGTKDHGVQAVLYTDDAIPYQGLQAFAGRLGYDLFRNEHTLARAMNNAQLAFTTETGNTDAERVFQSLGDLTFAFPSARSSAPEEPLFVKPVHGLLLSSEYHTHRYPGDSKDASIVAEGKRASIIGLLDKLDAITHGGALWCETNFSLRGLLGMLERFRPKWIIVACSIVEYQNWPYLAVQLPLTDTGDCELVNAPQLASIVQLYNRDAREHGRPGVRGIAIMGSGSENFAAHVLGLAADDGLCAVVGTTGTLEIDAAETYIPAFITGLVNGKEWQEASDHAAAQTITPDLFVVTGENF